MGSMIRTNPCRKRWIRRNYFASLFVSSSAKRAYSYQLGGNIRLLIQADGQDLRNKTQGGSGIGISVKLIRVTPVSHGRIDFVGQINDHQIAGSIHHCQGVIGIAFPIREHGCFLPFPGRNFAHPENGHHGFFSFCGTAGNKSGCQEHGDQYRQQSSDHGHMSFSHNPSHPRGLPSPRELCLQNRIFSADSDSSCRERS